MTLTEAKQILSLLAEANPPRDPEKLSSWVLAIQGTYLPGLPEDTWVNAVRALVFAEDVPFGSIGEAQRKNLAVHLAQVLLSEFGMELFRA